MSFHVPEWLASSSVGEKEVRLGSELDICNGQVYKDKNELYKQQ